MPTFKFVVGSKGKSYQIEKDQKDCPVMGKKIGEVLNGGFFGLEGYDLEITGGSDNDGFPMKKDIEGITRKKLIVIGGTGFHPSRKGLRRRKLLRGNSISPDITQINLKVVKEGAKPLNELLGKKETKEEKG